MNRLRPSSLLAKRLISRPVSCDGVVDKRSLKNPYNSLPRYSSILQSRIEDHYYKTLMEDLMILGYDHDAPLSSIDALQKHPDWIRPLPDNLLETIYETPLEKLPTAPFDDLPVTSLLTAEHSKIGEKGKSRGYRKRLYNPIDYTIVRKEEWDREDSVKVIEPFSPLPSRIPIPKKMILKIWADEAVKNKLMVLSSVMILQGITGMKAEPLFAEFGDASKGIREGMPMGAVVTVTGQRMFEFMDKLTSCVLPRMREWDGVEAIGDDAGAIALQLPKSAIGYFPDIEPHFDSFPRLFDIDVLIHTTAKSDWETALCLSAFQIPFKPKRIIKEIKAEESKDPWARFRKPQTKEERKALARKQALENQAATEPETA